MVVLVLVLGMVALGAVDPEARHVVPEFSLYYENITMVGRGGGGYFQLL